MVSIVHPDICLSTGGESWECVDTASVILTMDHYCHFHTRSNEAQERHLFIVLDAHHHSHLTIETPGLDNGDIQKPIVQRPIPLTITGCDGVARGHVIQEVYATHVGIVDLDDVWLVDFHFFLLLR